MTGTNCDLFTHKSSRSYLNHLVIPEMFSVKLIQTSGWEQHRGCCESVGTNSSTDISTQSNVFPCSLDKMSRSAESKRFLGCDC
jgi:hypothetical protein